MSPVKNDKNSRCCSTDNLENNKNVCQFIRIPFKIYEQYADQECLENEEMMNNLSILLPYYNDILKSKKKNILATFEEMEYHSSNAVLEREGQESDYIYWILSGEILFYKKIPGLYTELLDKEGEIMDKKIVKLSNLDKFINPSEAGKVSYGVKIGSMKGENILVGEAPALFKQLCGYTMIAGKNLHVMRYESKRALQTWPLETQRALKFGSLDKYKWIFERL